MIDCIRQPVSLNSKVDPVPTCCRIKLSDSHPPLTGCCHMHQLPGIRFNGLFVE